MTAEILFVSSSVILITILHIVKKRSLDSLPVLQFIYYLIVETGVLIYFASDLLRSNLAVGTHNVSNAFYNMIILVIFVAYKFKFVAILAGYIFGSGVVLIITLQDNFAWTNYQILLVLFILFFLCANYFRTNNTKHLLSMIRLEQAQLTLEELSNRDFLTKLYNRTALNDYVKADLGRAVGEGKPISLMMLDIDDFKAYNDNYSHMMGDKCLHDIAASIRAIDNDKFRAFRYGGEEFLIIGIDTNENDLKACATEILAHIRELAIERDDGLGSNGIVTASMGLALSMSVETSDYAALLLRADKELYRAKRAGKNCFFFRGNKFNSF